MPGCSYESNFKKYEVDLLERIDGPLERPVGFLALLKVLKRAFLFTPLRLIFLHPGDRILHRCLRVRLRDDDDLRLRLRFRPPMCQVSCRVDGVSDGGCT